MRSLPTGGAKDQWGVTITVGGRFHAAQAARAAWEAGLLRRLITGRRLNGQTWLKRAEIVHLPVPQYLGAGLTRLLHVPHLGSLLGDGWFDRWAAFHLPPCAVFHGWSAYSSSSMKIARAQGSAVVLEAGIHIEYQAEALKGAEARSGVPHPKMCRRWINRLVTEYENADYLIVWSELGERSFVGKGIDARKIRRIPLGVDTSLFSPAASFPERFTVLFVGTISRLKGIPTLLEAVSAIRSTGVELLLVGVVRDVTKCLRRYSGAYKLLPHRSAEQLAGIYKQASVLVLPSVFEGFGMVVLEAMASGLPAIVSRTVGAADLVEEGVDGYIVPAEDSHCIAERIEGLSRDRDLLTNMSRAARAKALRYPWSAYRGRVVDVYREASDAKGVCLKGPADGGGR